MQGRYLVDDVRYHALEEPTSLNTLELLPELLAANIASVKIEGRQRSRSSGARLAPAIDRCQAIRAYRADAAWMETARCPRHPNHAGRLSPQMAVAGGNMKYALGPYSTTGQNDIAAFYQQAAESSAVFISARASAPSGAR